MLRKSQIMHSAPKYTLIASGIIFAIAIILTVSGFADVMEIDVDLVSVKATTTEKLGYVGKEEGVNAHAVCLINSRN